MSTFQKVILVGNLGDDPEVNYLSNGTCVANASIATTETWKDKDGNKQSKTEWHRVVFFRKLAEIVEQYVKKGHKVLIEGKLQTRKWEDKDGNTKYTTEIVADQMTMLTSQGGNGSAKAEQQAAAYLGPQADRDLPLEAAEVEGSDPFKPGEKGRFDAEPDDLPFE